MSTQQIENALKLLHDKKLVFWDLQKMKLVSETGISFGLGAWVPLRRYKEERARVLNGLKPIYEASFEGRYPDEAQLKKPFMGEPANYPLFGQLLHHLVNGSYGVEWFYTKNPRLREVGFEEWKCVIQRFCKEGEEIIKAVYAKFGGFDALCDEDTDFETISRKEFSYSHYEEIKQEISSRLDVLMSQL